MYVVAVTCQRIKIYNNIPPQTFKLHSLKILVKLKIKW